MTLSKFSDYAFRLLIYLANNTDRLCTVEELASNLDISENHLKKIVQRLAKTDYITSLKGRNGGLKLGMNPEEIFLDKILLITEEGLDSSECFSSARHSCNYSCNCKFKKILNNSVNMFINEFSKSTLKDIL